MSQRFTQVKTAIVAADGSCSFTFDAPPAGYVLTGSINVPGSPTGIVWVIQPSDVVVPIATMRGNNPATGIQAIGNETLALTGTGLSPGTSINAIFTGIASPESQTAFIPPGNTPADTITSAAARVVGSATGTFGSSHSVTCSLQQTDRSLIVFINSPPTATYTVDIVGLTSGLDWTTLQGIGPANSIVYTGPVVFTIPCYGLIDPRIRVNATLTGGTVTGMTVLAVPDEILVGSFGSPDYIKTVPDQGLSDLPAVQPSIAAGTTQTMLAVPTNNQAYWIKYAVVTAPTTVANPALSLFIRSITNQVPLVGAKSVTTGIFAFQAFDELVIADGFECVNQTAVTAGAWIYSTTVSTI